MACGVSPTFVVWDEISLRVLCFSTIAKKWIVHCVETTTLLTQREKCFADKIAFFSVRLLLILGFARLHVKYFSSQKKSSAFGEVHSFRNSSDMFSRSHTHVALTLKSRIFSEIFCSSSCRRHDDNSRWEKRDIPFFMYNWESIVGSHHPSCWVRNIVFRPNSIRRNFIH